MVERPHGAAVLALAALAFPLLTLAACTSASSAPRPVGTARRTTGASTASRANGTVFTRTISGGATDFRPRPASVYLPPAARTHPSERFPVLVLLHGTNDSPSAWLTKGAVRTTLDAFAAAHDGRAPVILMPDINGSTSADTECVRSSTGADVERYLLDNVPAWISYHLPVSTDHRRWGIAGLSEGGTCALMLGLRSYPTFSFVGDFSGLARLTVGDTDDPARTIATLFGGSRAAYDAHDPAVLLRARRYPLLDTWFECGSTDHTVVEDQTALAAAARGAVRRVHISTIPGRHNWAVWRPTLVSALPWFWAGAA